MQQSHRPLGVLIAMLGWLTAASSLATDIYLPALPSMREALAASGSAVQYSLSLFFAGLALGQLIYGPLSDRYGRKPLLLFGFALYGVACLLAAFAQSAMVLIAARALQGLGAAAGQVIPRAMVRDHFQGAKAASVISFVVMVMASAPLIAPLLGSLVISLGSWRDIFWLLCGYAGLSLVVITFGLGESHPPALRVKDRSLAAQYAGYLTLLSQGPFLCYLLCGALMFAVLFCFVCASSFVYISQYGVDKAMFGFYFSFNMIAMLLGNLINGRVVERYGYARLLGIAIGNTLLWTLVLLVDVLSGVGGLWGLVLPAFFMLLTVAMAGANAVAGLLDLAHGAAGAASALFGIGQFSLGALVSVAIALLGNNALALAMVTVLLAGLALLFYLRLRRFSHDLARSA